MIRKEIFIGLSIALFLAIIIAPFACPWPDGLEWVAEIKGFLHLSEVKPIFNSPIPDYVCPWIKNEGCAIAVAGVIGTLLVFGISLGVAHAIKYRQSYKH